MPRKNTVRNISPTDRDLTLAALKASWRGPNCAANPASSAPCGGYQRHGRSIKNLGERKAENESSTAAQETTTQLGSALFFPNTQVKLNCHPRQPASNAALSRWRPRRPRRKMPAVADNRAGTPLSPCFACLAWAPSGTERDAFSGPAI